VNFIIDNWSLFLVALASGGLLLWPTVQGATGGSLQPNGAVQLINREKAVLIDISEPDEYARAHAVGARNVPLGELETRLPQVVKNKSLPVVLICASGGRATRAVTVAKKLGYEQAQAVAGGLKGWKDANLPVVAEKA
jgi:rhodanese-related sulfurtransferase